MKKKQMKKLTFSSQKLNVRLEKLDKYSKKQSRRKKLFEEAWIKGRRRATT